MANANLERGQKLKQALVDFVYDAEGEIAAALEAYVAKEGSRERHSYDLRQQNLVVDRFLSEGKIGERTPLDLFLASESDLTESDRALIQSWRRSFTGLFEVVRVLPAGFELMNWLTAKHYPVLLSQDVDPAEAKRWQPGDILLTRIAPIEGEEWMFSGACMPKGKLGKPKLAVAIGEFRDKYKESLYSDAPELLEQAWESVQEYHQEFVEFFGSDRLTLSGYELNQKLATLQEQMSQKRLAAAGIDSSKSLAEMAEEAGVETDELAAAAVEAGTDSDAIAQMLESKVSTQMRVPKTNLLNDIKRAEQVAIFSHPRWGQTILTTYPKLQTLLETAEPQAETVTAALVRKYLEDPQVNYFIWQQLRGEYASKLEVVLAEILERPNFKIEGDLETTLQEFKKPLEPELPEIASVPLHLHNLFEEAMAQTRKGSASKSKGKRKKKKGFQGS